MHRHLSIPYFLSLTVGQVRFTQDWMLPNNIRYSRLTFLEEIHTQQKSGNHVLFRICPISKILCMQGQMFLSNDGGLGKLAGNNPSSSIHMNNNHLPMQQQSQQLQQQQQTQPSLIPQQQVSYGIQVGSHWDIWYHLHNAATNDWCW